ncbi:hypothetical protein D3C75_238670 [compost metagenome]
MIEIYVLLSIPFGWKFISKLQRNITVFTTNSNYIVYKVILSVFVGWGYNSVSSNTTPNISETSNPTRKRDAVSKMLANHLKNKQGFQLY